VATRLYRARGRLKKELERLDPTLVEVDESSNSAGEESP
jgi:hypothetical protein